MLERLASAPSDQGASKRVGGWGVVEPRRRIRVVPDPILRAKTVPVARVGRQERALTRAMIRAMLDADGIGLAANQVGELVRIIVLRLPDRVVGICNPVITAREGDQLSVEGCLSIPGVLAVVRRAEHVRLNGLGESGAPIELHLSGVYAAVAQHEIDHLDGILITDRAVAVVQASEGGKGALLAR